MTFGLPDVSNQTGAKKLGDGTIVMLSNLPGCRARGSVGAGGGGPPARTGSDPMLLPIGRPFIMFSSAFPLTYPSVVVHKGVSSIHRERNSRTQDRVFAFGPDGGLVACVTVV